MWLFFVLYIKITIFAQNYHFTNMKHFFKLVVLSFLLLVTACNKGGDEIHNEDKPDTPEQPETKAPFKVEVIDITATAARVSVTPTDKGSKYYFDLLRAEYYKEYNEEFGFQRFIDNTIKNLMESNNFTKDEVLSRILSAGDDSYGFTNLSADTEYYAVAMGIDSKGLITTDIISVKFSTEKAKESNNTFKITLGSSSYTGVTYSVKPTNTQERYVLIPWNKATVDRLGNDFIAHCLKARSDIESYVVTGNQSGNIDSCIPGRDYYLIAFGYEGGLATTPLTKVPFSTKSGGDPATCSFTFEVSNIQYDRAYMKVSPSVKHCVFFWSVVEKDYYEKISAEMGAQKAMESVLAESLAPFAQDFGNLNDALEIISSFDDVSVEGTTYGLVQGTQYIPWAVCIDQNGNAVAPFVMGDSFATKSDIISDCKVVVKGSFSKGDDGYAIVSSTVTPDEKCAGFYNVIFQGDLSEASRQSLIRNIIKDEYFKNLNPCQFGKCPWNQPVSAVAVGYDSDGNFGEIAIDVFTPTK